MREFLILLLGALHAAVRARADLVAENLSLRHQLTVLTRPGLRPLLRAHDMLLRMLAGRLRIDWLRYLARPNTVVCWHRGG
jgi:hypothetical protein